MFVVLYLYPTKEYMIESSLTPLSIMRYSMLLVDRGENQKDNYIEDTAPNMEQ